MSCSGAGVGTAELSCCLSSATVPTLAHSRAEVSPEQLWYGGCCGKRLLSRGQPLACSRAGATQLVPTAVWEVMGYLSVDWLPTCAGGRCAVIAPCGCMLGEGCGSSPQHQPTKPHLKLLHIMYSVINLFSTSKNFDKLPSVEVGRIDDT